MGWLEDHLTPILALVGAVVFVIRQEGIARTQSLMLAQLEKGFMGVNARLDTQNGRIGRLERWRAYQRGKANEPIEGDVS